MKKTILAVFFSLFVFSSAHAALGVNVGVSAQVGSADTKGSEKNSDGVTATEVGDAEEFLFGTASYFIEKDLSFLPGPFGRIAIGYDQITHDMDLGTQTNVRDASLGASGAVVPGGDNTLKASISGFSTFYGTFHITDWLYVKGGSVTVDVDTEYFKNGVKQTSYANSHSLDGNMMGFGVQKTSDNGMFFRLEYNDYDIEGKTVKSTGTDSKFTAVLDDVDGSSGRISIGKSF